VSTRWGLHVADDSADRSTDERARAALDALRASSGGARVERAPGDPSWWEVVERRLLERWPAVSDGAWRLALMGVGAGVGLVVALLVVPRISGEAAGGPAPPVTLPFTTTTSGTAGTTTTATSRVVVHAAGAVAEPGVHEVAAGARVADVLAAAGGSTPDADLDRVNLAAAVSDGQRLYVPRRGEAGSPVVAGDAGGGGGSGATGDGVTGGSTGAGGAGGAGPIDLNTAGVAQLDTLPGVGPSTASAIVEHREANGPFTSIEQLLDVRGIGPSKLDALRDLVTVG